MSMIRETSRAGIVLQLYGMCEPVARELLASNFLETVLGRKRPNKPEECTGQKPDLCSSICRGLSWRRCSCAAQLECVFLLG